MENISNLWIKISDCRNYIAEDPILDWLDMYGKKNNFKKDSSFSNEFENILQQKNSIFQEKIIDQIKNEGLSLYCNKKGMPIRERVSKTIDNMYSGCDIIIYPGLYNGNNNCYGIPSMIIRSDKINKIIKNGLLVDNKKKSCKFSNHFHYIVIEVKHTKLKLDCNYQITNNKTNKILKANMILYDYCLGFMQEYLPKESFVIAKNYALIEKGEKKIITNSFLGIGKINLDNNKEIINKSFSSIKWLHELNVDGKDWSVLPPTNKHLYPNMCNQDDFPWHNEKLNIANKISEITMLWNCGPKIRKKAHLNGIYKWNKIDTEILNIKGKKKNIINKIIDINCYSEDIDISPRKIKKTLHKEIIFKENLEFVVDFETINNFTEGVVDNQMELPFIFMIGCLTIFKNEKGIYEQEFRNFTTKNLENKEEKRIINEWINYMDNFKNIYDNKYPKIYHWSNAEPVIYNQYLKKYNLQINNNLNFKDLLYVFKNEPIVVKGTFSYNLKEISKALNKFGLIETIWEDDNMNGKEAMIQAWLSYNKNRGKYQKNIIKKIKKYNYVDCKVIDEILDILRKMK